jgi:hypothetical protein
MKQPRATSTTLAQLETALEVCCGVLMAVVAMRARAHDTESQIRDVEGQMIRAIDSLRDAMAELRLVHGEEASALAFGFVLSTAMQS